MATRSHHVGVVQICTAPITMGADDNDENEKRKGKRTLIEIFNWFLWQVLLEKYLDDVDIGRG